jgi:type II secretory pathway pseudopilin PulG
VEQVMLHGSWQSERGFSVIELMIIIILMGIVFAIASSSWIGAVEGRRVTSATNQMVADLRQAHTSATNRLANHEVRLTDNSSTYQVGPPAALETYTLPDDTKVDTPGATLNIAFKPDGSTTSGALITFNVSSADGNPNHTITINHITSKVEVDG